MLTNLIENRGKEFSNLLKLSDYLARSLRENVELFHVENGKATFITESGGVITGTYQIKPTLKLSNIQIDDASILENQEAFESVVGKKVSLLLGDLLESDYSNADSSFDEILNLFETKLSFERIKTRLQEKSERFGEQNRIVSSPEFQKVAELKDKLVEFLKENKNIVKIPEIKNGLKLASVVSKAFNTPRITLEQLAEKKTFQVKLPSQGSIYEHLCRQELVAKELLEAKQNFDTTWANNDLLNELASMIFEKKRSKIEEKVASVVSNIPYFALATKKQISTIFENSLKLSDVEVSTKDLTNFVSTIFEMKKPVKNYIIKILNEKYGININNLTEVPTFSNLLKTETVILASLARLAPKNSLIKEHLGSFAESLKLKNGSEAIDLVEFLNEVFEEAGLSETLNETSLLQYLDFAQVADDLGKIGSILKLLRPVLGATGGMGDGGMGGIQPGVSKTPPMTQPLPGNEEGAEEIPNDEGIQGQEGDNLGDQGGDAEMAAKGALADEEMNGEDPTQAETPNPLEGGAEGGEEDPLAAALGGGMEEEPQEPVDQVNGDDITNIVASIENLLANIKSEIGGGDIEGEEDATGLDLDGDGEAGEEDLDTAPMEGGAEEGLGSDEPPPEEEVDGSGKVPDEEEIEFEDATGDSEEDSKEPPVKKGKKPPFKK